MADTRTLERTKTPGVYRRHAEAGTAACLAEMRPEGAGDTPVFPSATGTPLTCANVYNRVLRPALRDCGLDGQGIAFHAFRKACGSLLLANGKSLKQVQGWLRHSQLATTMNVYIHEVDDGLGDADVWDGILGSSDPQPTRAGKSRA